MLPLDGVKVVDLSHAAAGPCCTMLLADMGADVIKIEPIEGEHFRRTSSETFIMNLGRNKRDMAVNLKDKEGRQIALRLAERADVFVENFTPGTIDKLGLGYDVISQLNPRIVYCSTSGFGQTGPYCKRPVLDPVAQAISGIMMLTGEAGRLPVRIAPSTIDYGTGMLGAYGIALALLNREKSGKGQKVDVSLLDTALLYVSHFITAYSLTGQLPIRMGSGHSMFAPYQVFEAANGHIFIGVFTEKTWKDFCQVLGLDNMAGDPRYATNDVRCQNRDELTKTLSQVIRQYSSEDLVAKLITVDIPCAPLLDVSEVIDDPQVLAREMLIDMDYPEKGEGKIIRTPISFSEMMPQIKFRAPLLGEHTTEVLKELGYNQAEIDQLAKKGIILQHIL